MAHTVKAKKSILARVRRIGGQVAALEKAVDGEQDCNDVLQQIASIRGAINGLMAVVVEGHVRDHLGTGTVGSAPHRREVEALVAALRAYMK